MIETVIFVFLVSSVSILGSLYVRKYQKPDALVGIYVGSVLVSNILAYKIASYDLGVFTLFAPASVIIFSVTYLLTDIVNERFGREATLQMIWVAFLTQLVAVVFILIAIALPSAPFWTDQEAFSRILSSAPRVIAASLFTFIIMETLDAYVFHWFKQKTQGRHLWLRNVASTIPAMTLDTILFVFLAFYGVFPILQLIIGVIVIKWLVGVIDIPFMYLNRWIMNKT